MKKKVNEIFRLRIDEYGLQIINEEKIYEVKELLESIYDQNFTIIQR